MPKKEPKKLQVMGKFGGGADMTIVVRENDGESVASIIDGSYEALGIKMMADGYASVQIFSVYGSDDEGIVNYNCRCEPVTGIVFRTLPATPSDNRIEIYYGEYYDNQLILYPDGSITYNYIG